jgi:hypothetical protein
MRPAASRAHATRLIHSAAFIPAASVPARVNAPAIEPLQQGRELRSRQPNDAVLDIRAPELAVLELLGEQTHPGAVPMHRLHAVGTRSAEHVHRPRERITIWQSKWRSLHVTTWGNTLIRLVAYGAYTFALHYDLNQRCQCRELVRLLQRFLPLLHSREQAASVAR